MSGELSRDLASLRIESPPPETEAPRHRKRWIWLLVLAAVVGIAVLGGLQLQSKLSRPQVRLGEIITLSPAQADVKLMTTGYVVPLRRAIVASKIIARVDKILVHEGENVTEGQVLAELDADEARAVLAEAKAATLTAQARVTAAQANVHDAQRQWERETELFEKSASTKAGMEAAQSRLEVAKANLEAAKADVGMASARKDNAQNAFNNTRIVAPFAGRVVRKMAEVGEVPASTTMGPGGVVELVGFASLVVEADVSEGRISQVRLAGPAEITLDAQPTQRLRGEVIEIRPTVDRQKATVLVRVKFKDPVEGVLPQMAARVLFLGQELSEASLREPAKVVVPNKALVERDGQTFVFSAQEGKARKVSVTLGKAIGQGREVKSGISPGTKILLEPPASLSDGDAFKEIQ